MIFIFRMKIDIFFDSGDCGCICIKIDIYNCFFKN